MIVPMHNREHSLISAPVRAVIMLLSIVLLSAPPLGCESVMEVMRDSTVRTPAERRPMSTLVYPSEGGRLEYTETADGDRIPDFSNCGYMGGGVAIPKVPVRITLEPQPGDDTRRIQAAIDE